MAERLRTEPLPHPWSYAVTSDGRVFFINDDTRTTTWVHPVTGRPVASGYEDREDLPDGWQEGVSPENQVYFVNHYDETTSYRHPITGRTEMETDGQEDPQLSTSLEHAPVPTSPYPEAPQSPTSVERPSFKQRTIPKNEAPRVKRREGDLVSKLGWLHKKDSSGLGVWRKRWCVISDFCLFYYKGDDKVNPAGTIMLPSYDIEPVEPKDKINRKHAFKCEHDNMRTYIFAADSDEKMHQWIEALKKATQVQVDRGYGDEMEWGGSDVRRPRSVRSTDSQPSDEPDRSDRDETDAPPQTRVVSPAGSMNTRRPGWGNYEEIVTGMPPRGGTMKNGVEDPRGGRSPPVESDRSYREHSPRGSWEGSQPRSHHDNTSRSSSQEDRRPGMPGHRSPPGSPSIHSSSSRDRSYVDDGAREPPSGYNYVDIAEIKQRKRLHQQGVPLSRETSYEGHPDSRFVQSPGSQQSDRYHSNGYPTGRDGMEEGGEDSWAKPTRNSSLAERPYAQSPEQRTYAQSPNTRDSSRHPTQERRPDVTQGDPRGVRPEGQRPDRRPTNTRRSDSRRSTASERSISEPSQQRGLAPMEEVPVLRVSTERLQQSAPRPTEPYHQRPSHRGRESSMHERESPMHDRAPPHHERVPSEHGRPPSQHGRGPPRHDRTPSQSSRTPSRASTMSRDTNRQERPQGRERSMERRQGRERSMDRPPGRERSMERTQSRERSMDSADIAPSRQSRASSSSSQPVSRSDTLKRQELEREDDVPPLQPLAARQAGQKTGRLRIWQQKTQQFVDLSTGIRLRLSIAAGDLLGKSHEELVLFLIQLRRDKANLQEWLDMIDNELALLQDPGSSPATPSKFRSSRRSDPRLSNTLDLEEERQYYNEVVQERDEVARELDISAPLINLVDNLVRMGSLYGGGDNRMIAQEFYSDKVQKGLPYSPPKKLIEFSRRLEEEKLVQDLEEELKQLETAEDIELQEKLDQLHELDKKLQEISSRVSILKDEKDKIENTMERLDRQITQNWDDKETVARIEEQQRQLERQLIRVRSQLAQGTKELEEITTENSRIEHEVALMRSGMEGIEDISREHTADSAKERLQMEREVSHVQSVMNGLERQRTALANQMDSLRRTTPKGAPGKVVHRKSSREALLSGPYAVTDLDTKKTYDIRSLPVMPTSPERGDMSHYFDSSSGNFDPGSGNFDQGSGNFDPSSDQLVSPGVHVRRSGPYDLGENEFSDPTIGTKDPSFGYGDQDPGGYHPARGQFHQSDPVSGGPQYHDSSRDQEPFDQAESYDQDGNNPGFDRQVTERDYGRYDSSIDQETGVQSGAPTIPAFDDVMGAEDGPVAPINVDSGWFDQPSNDLPDRQDSVDQTLVTAQYSAPAYQELPRRSSGGGRRSGKGYTSTNLDTREMYPESGAMMQGRGDPEWRGGDSREGGGDHRQGHVDPRHSQGDPRQSQGDPRQSHGDPRQSHGDPRQSHSDSILSHNESRQSLGGGRRITPLSGGNNPSRSQKDVQEQQFPPSPLASLDVTPVGTLHYTSLSPDGFNDPPPRKQTPQRSSSYSKIPPDSVQLAPQTYAAPPKPGDYADPPSASEEKPFGDSVRYVAHLPASSSTTLTEGPGPRSEGPGRSQYTASPWQSYDEQPQESFGYNSRGQEREPFDSSYRSDDNKRPPERKSSVYGPTPFRKSSMDSTSGSIRSISSITGVARRRKPGMNEEKINRRKSATERLLQSKPQKDVHRDAFSDTETDPTPARIQDKPLQPSKSLSGLSNDLAIRDINKALTTADEEENEEEKRRKGNYVYKSDLKNVEFDDTTGGGLLGMPAKIRIPERYNPAVDEDSDLERETDEDRERRDEKARKMAKIISSQSMQEWHPREIIPNWNGRGEPASDMKERVEREKEIREGVLVQRRALAQEVSQQTKILAGTNESYHHDDANRHRHQNGGYHDFSHHRDNRYERQYSKGSTSSYDYSDNYYDDEYHDSRLYNVRDEWGSDEARV